MALGAAAALSIGGVLLTAPTVSATVPDVGQLSVLAGTGTAGTPTLGPADRSMLDNPFAVVLDASGNLYIADALNHDVEKVTPAGTLSIFAGTGHQGATIPGRATHSPLYYPDGVAVGPSGSVYIADAGNHVIDRVSASGTLSILAGTGTSGPSTPGPATHSDLNYPFGLAVTAAGAVYIADTFNDEVDKVSPTGMLSVAAGTGSAGPVTPGPATHSSLDHPTGVAVSATGKLFIADTFRSEVVEVSATGMLSVFAGTGVNGTQRAGPATRSELNYCYDVAVDPAGNVYIADTFNHVVEKVSPSGYLGVVAGTGQPGTPTTGPALIRNLSEPDGVVVNGSGSLYISDYATNEVVKVVAPVVGIAAPARGGYVDVTAAGGVYNHRSTYYGSALLRNRALPSPIAGIAAVADGGYILATAAGNVYTYGTAYHGSPHASRLRLSSPVVGIAATRNGGYILVTAAGNVYTYGTAYHGSPHASRVHLTSPITGIAATRNGGYVLATTAGNVYHYGTPFHGSPHNHHVRLTSPIVGIAATPGGGYLVATTAGRVYHYGTPFRGSPATAGVTLVAPIVGIAATPGGSYYLTTSGGTVYKY